MKLSHLLVFIAMLWLSSCATIPTVTPVAPVATAKPPEVAITKSQTAKRLERSSSHSEVRDIENLSIGDVILITEPDTHKQYDDSRYDFPITMNSRVEGWIDYFTGRGRQHMERYLGRSSRYIPRMKEVFKNAGMPEDLVYLALIESGFNLRARSRAKAVGPWQFIKGTGSRYGLEINSWIDERRDPIRSTQAAANYLKDLYLMFESWYLAAAAYNAGEYKILRAIESLKTNNFWAISQTSAIRRETKDYIPKLISAAIIAKNPKKYGFEDVAYLDPLEFDTLQVDSPVHLRDIAKVVDAPEDDIFDLNPELIHHRIPPHFKTYELRVPTGSTALVKRYIASGPKSSLPVKNITSYTVRRGDTLDRIARKYRVSTAQLADINGLTEKARLRPGQDLVVTESSRIPNRPRATSSVSAPTPEVTASGEFITHTVKRGDSLWSISEKYNVTVQQIFQWNALHKSRIHPGKKLKIGKL